MQKSSSLKGVANVKRRTWDKAFFDKQAQNSTTEQEKKKRIVSNKEEFKHAEEGAAGPIGTGKAFISSRQNKLDLESSIGVAKIIKGDDKAPGAGYFCEVCEINLKDSVAYVDHINSKRHLTKIGFSMRMDRSTVQQVKDRLKAKSKATLNLKAPVLQRSAMEEYEERLQKEKEAKELLKLQKKERKKKKQEEVEEAPADPDMMALMGFGSFGSSKPQPRAKEKETNVADAAIAEEERKEEDIEKSNSSSTSAAPIIEKENATSDALDNIDVDQDMMALMGFS